jgi:hypothetical protein
MTNVPSPAFTPLGFIVPSDADILAGVLADNNAAFGGGLNPALETSQGQLATSESAIIANTDDQFVNLTQQMDPAYNSGRYQDAIGRIYYITRKPALPTVVPCVCNGDVGTPIPAGSLARDTSGNIYTCTDGGTIPEGGNITLQFSNNQVGPIACPAGTLSEIYLAIPGWDSITNPDDGVLGQNTESRAAFEARRRESVAKNARGTIQAIQGTVLEVDDVLDAFSYQNDSSSPITYRGVVLLANSIYVAAVGGSNLDVATAIWSKKAPGAGYNGNTTVLVYDTSPGYSEPYPSYEVTFRRPDELTIVFLVKIANNALVPSDAATQIQNAIISAFAGADGGTRARIGSTIYASRYVCPVAALGPWAQVVSLQIGSINAPDATITGSITGANLNATAVAAGVVAVGQELFGDGIAEGTYILSQISGSPGGIGHYEVSISQTVASTTVKGVSATDNTVGVNIDQVPVTAPIDIQVILV